MRRRIIVGAVLLASACTDELVEVPKRPVAGICAPGARYSCPCGAETWEQRSGVMYCGGDFHVTPCECDGGADGVDE